MCAKPYHEKQVRQLCALHALNNLLQEKAFTKADLDAICERLAPDSRLVNPHRSVLGLGNYDVNVVMCALDQRQLEAVWFDKRKDAECLDLDKIYGFIINIPNPSLGNGYLNPMNLIMSRKHWLAVRKIGDTYYNLDSKLEHPVVLGKEPELKAFLRKKNESDDCEILVVVQKVIASDQSWLKSTGTT